MRGKDIINGDIDPLSIMGEKPRMISVRIYEQWAPLNYWAIGPLRDKWYSCSFPNPSASFIVHPLFIDF